MTNGLEIIEIVRWGWPTYTVLKTMTNLRPGWAINNFASGGYSWMKKRLTDLLYLSTFASIESRWACQLFVLLRKP